MIPVYLLFTWLIIHYSVNYFTYENSRKSAGWACHHASPAQEKYSQILKKRVLMKQKTMKNRRKLNLLNNSKVWLNFIPISVRISLMTYNIVAYPDFQFRKLGCMGGGNRVLYINSYGEVNACPFCQNNKTNIKSDSIENILKELSKTKCENFVSTMVW